MELAPYILGTELDVEHGGMDMRMAHEPHEGREADSGADHIRSESMPEAVGIGVRNRAAAAAVAKHGPQPGRRQRLSPVGALENDENQTGVRFWPFHAKIALKQLDCLRIKGKQSFPVSFSPDEDLALSESKVFELEAEDLTGAQSVKQHQRYDTQVAKGAKTAPEFIDLRGR
jgi:hypothetical protein